MCLQHTADMYISLIVSFVQASRLGHRQSFSFTVFPLGFLPGFLICPLFPLSSPGYFPRNSSATFFSFFFSSMSRPLLLILCHTWRIHGIYCILPAVYPLARLQMQNDNLNTRQRKLPCDCRLNRSPAQSATLGLNITPHHSCN